MGRESFFDCIPLQRDLRAQVGHDLEGDGDYLRLRILVPEFLRRLGKDLKQVKSEVKRYTFGAAMREKVRLRRGEMSTRYANRFAEFLSDYERAWNLHDNFSLILGLLIERYFKGEMGEGEFLRFGKKMLPQAVENDINLHLYTFSLQNVLAQKLGPKGTGHVFPFEDFINEEALVLSEKEFADKYAYGDIVSAEYLIEKTGILSLTDLEEVADWGYRDYRMAPKGEDFYKINRLAHWEVYEEPRRRFSVLFGIFDYLFREALFQKTREMGRINKDASCSLDIPASEFMMLIEGAEVK